MEIGFSHGNLENHHFQWIGIFPWNFLPSSDKYRGYPHDDGKPQPRGMIPGLPGLVNIQKTMENHHV